MNREAPIVHKLKMRRKRRLQNQRDTRRGSLAQLAIQYGMSAKRYLRGSKAPA